MAELLIPPDWVNVPVEVRPTLSLAATERMPPDICTFPPPLLLPKESMSHDWDNWLTTAVPPLSI